jgi:hypothetical protein
MQPQDTQNQNPISIQNQNNDRKEMTTQVITIYCLCDDFLRARH